MVPRGSIRFGHIGVHSKPDGWRLKSHAHDRHEMVVVLDGRQWVTICGREIEARAGDVLLYPPGTPHEEWSRPRETLRTCFVSFRWERARSGLPVIVHDARGRIREMAGWLHDERGAATAEAVALRNALVGAMLAEYERATSARDHPLVEKVRAFATARLADPLSLDDLAEVAGLSRHHFARSYRALSGVTPMADLRRIRMEEARSLLMTTDLPLKSIAPRVGLESQYHLSRLFRQHFGVCARDLRKRVSE